MPEDEGRFGYDDFLSPFTWRYGGEEMRRLFSERRKRATWRKVWLALAESQAELGLIGVDELEGIRARSGAENVDIERAHAVEKMVRHDLMAELRTFAEQAGKGGGKLHLGATSMDIEDNADVMLYVEAVQVLLSRMADCLAAAKGRILEHKGTVCMAWTHLQPAEPTTLGYRFANYAQDLVMDVELLEAIKERFLKGKGVKGAVGTSASYRALLGKTRPEVLEGKVAARLRIGAYEVSTQTYPRKLDYLLLAALASIAQSCHKFGLDLRVMQSPAFGEMSEPIGSKQVGSSAMPFKRNPVSSERMCSLARFVSVLPSVAFMNAASSILERTLDDSAARRIAIPEAFLAVDECLATYQSLMQGLRVNPAMIQRNLQAYGPFAGTEALMMKLVEEGGDRQDIHEKIRVASFKAWEGVMEGRDNGLEAILLKEKWVSSKLSKARVRELLDPTRHVGDAEERCEAFVRRRIDPVLRRHKPGAVKGGPSY